MRFLSRCCVRILVALLASVAAIAAIGASVADEAVSSISGGCRSSGSWNEQAIARDLKVAFPDMVKLLQIRKLSFAEVCAMTGDELAREVQASSNFQLDKRAARAKYLAMQRASEDGHVLPDGLRNAVEARKEVVRSSRGQRTKLANISPGGWTALGPGNIGGRIRAVLTHPTDPNWLMIGSVSGGIWKSLNAGASWAAVNDFLPNLAISSLVRDPSNPQRIYAGTGEGLPNFDRILGFGVFVSNDGGDHWSQLGGTVPEYGAPPVTQQSDFQQVNRIDVHPTNPNIVLVATGGYFCRWGGVYRTVNALAPMPTWTLVYAHRSLDVKFDPNNGNNVIVGEGNHCFPAPNYPSAGGAVGYSTDTGQTFNRVPLDLTTLGRVEVAWARATPNLAVVVTEGNGGSGASGRLWFSSNAGQTWALNSQPGHLAGQGWFNNSVWVDPTDSNRLVVGGIDLHRAAGAASWWASNTPLPWTKISDRNVFNSVHADNHAIVAANGFDGSGNRVVYIGNDGGLYKSADIASHNGVDFATNWSSLNNGLEITQFYGGAGKSGYPGNVTLVIGGSQDNGSLKAPPSGTGWGKYFANDGGYSAVDPVDPAVYYGEYPWAGVVRSRPVGTAGQICQGTAENTNNIKDGFTGAAGSVYPNSNCGSLATTEANFITPLILDPNNANTLLVGAKSLWRSVDAKATTPIWAAIKVPSAVSGNYISAVAVAPGNSNLIWVGHNNGELYCTINGTVASPTWTKVNTINARWLMSLRVDQSNSNRVFATYGGFNPGNVQELTDPVQVCKAIPTVTNRQGNLPAAPTRSLVRHPTNSDWLYVATDVGIFASVDGGVSWSASNDGPASVAVFELFFLDDATLVAVTHGRGMFKASVVTPVYATLDIDQNGTVDAATDGVMVLRYLLGLTGNAITAGATGVGANRTDSQVIYDYLTSIRPQLDIDSDIQINAATDGLLIVRYMRQLRGDALILNALGSGTARSTSEIEDYLLGLSQ